MRDLTEQLTAYFDATVERVTAKDVVAGSDVRSQNGRLAPAQVPRLRPTWVVAAGFVATVALVGGAVGVATLLEGNSAGVGTAPSPVGDAADGLSGPWALLTAAGAILVLAMVGLTWRRRKNVKEQRMQTLERPEVEVSPRPRSPAMLILLIALLVLAAGALGWWIGSSGDGVVMSRRSLSHGTRPGSMAMEGLWLLYVEDGIYETIDVSTGVGRLSRESGKSDIRDTASSVMAMDFERFSADYVTVLEDVIIYSWTAEGTTPIVPFETTGVTVLEMEDGLIAKSVMYYNSVELYGGESS